MSGFVQSGRFGGQFDPLTITGLTHWYDTSDLSTYTYSSGVLVSQLADKSGNGNHLVQATPAFQPSRNITRNGLDAISTSVASYMIAPATNSGTTLSVYIVTSPESGNNGPLLDYVDIGSAQDWNTTNSSCVFQLYSTPRVETYRNGTKSAISVAWSTWMQMSHVSDGSTATNYLNGTAGSSTASTGTFAVDAVAFGANWISSSWQNGRISANYAEIIVSTAAHGTAERQAIEAYLKAKWSTP